MAGHIFATFQFYSYAIIQILIEPKRFFSELPSNTSLIKSLGFCLGCCVFFTGAHLLTGDYNNMIFKGGMLLISSLGMAIFCSMMSYLIMISIIGRKTGFNVIFGIHAFSSGAMLLISWISFFFWIAECWKWWLIYTGFRNAGQMTVPSSFLVLFLTLTIQLVLLFNLFPVLFRS